MVARQSRRSALIATLGAKPQLVTLAMDCLREKGEVPELIVCIHGSRRRVETESALRQLRSDIKKNFPSTKFKELELADQGQPLTDITSPDQVQAAFRSMYAEIRALKVSGLTIHLLIAGGRKTLAVFGMAAAQMLFDDQDCLWHLASHPALEESGRLHSDPGEWARLISIPLIPWGRLSPVFDALREVDDPFDAVQRLGELRLREHWDRARIFILTKLTPSEASVVELLSRDGMGQNEIANKLALSPRTVEQHLRSAYRKAAEHWELENVNQTQLVRLLAPFYISSG